MSAPNHAPTLFTPWTIPGSSLTLVNRIAIPPMCMYSADRGKMTAYHKMHVGRMCTSGVGLVIVEATAVLPEGRISPWCCGIWDEETAAAMKAVLDEVRSYEGGHRTPVALQLQHAGFKGSSYRPFRVEGDKRGQIPPPGEGCEDDPLAGWQTVGAGTVPFNPSDNPPTQLTTDGIKAVVAAFAAAAVRADAAGFDAVELHFAHGYLGHQFLSPWSNTRTDEYGGSLENRMRMPLETFAAVRAAFPAGKPVWVRISATDWTKEAGHNKGWDLEESIVFCQRLKQIGCEVVHVSSGGASPLQRINPLPGYQLHHARRIREEASVATIGVGCITQPGEAELALVSGTCDCVAIGRQMLYNPHWAMQAAHELGGTVSHAAGQYWRCEPAPQQNIFGQ